MRWHRWARAGAAGALAVAATSLGPWPASADAPWGPDYFPNVPLVTHDGRTVRFYDDLLKGKAVAINVVYTTCRDECPVETAWLVQVQRRLGDVLLRDELVEPPGSVRPSESRTVCGRLLLHTPEVTPNKVLSPFGVVRPFLGAAVRRGPGTGLK